MKNLSLMRKILVFFVIIYVICNFILILLPQAMAGRLENTLFSDYAFVIISYSEEAAKALPKWFIFFLLGVNLGEVFSLLLYFVLLCVFWYRCYNHLNLLTKEGTKRNKHWGWAGFLVPIISFYMPVSVGNEIKNLNQTAKKAWSIEIWWVLYLASFFLENITEHFVSDINAIANAYIFIFVLNALFSIMFIQISYYFVKSQQEEYALIKK